MSEWIRPAACQTLRPRRRCQGCDQLLQPSCFGYGVAVAAPGGAGHPLKSTLRLLEVGVDQLGLDRLDVRHGIDSSLWVDDARVTVDPHDVDDRVRLSDIGQE